MREARWAATEGTGRRVWVGGAVKLVVVTFVCFIATYLAVNLARSQNQISPIWLTNAIVLGAILTSPRRDGWKFLVLGGLANCGADLLIGDALVRAIPLPLINMAEVLACVGLLTRLHGPNERLDLTKPAVLTSFCLTILGPVPLLSGLLSATLLSSFGDVRFADALSTWVPAHGLGLLAVTPLLLLPLSEDVRVLRNPRYARNFAMVMAVYAATLFAVFAQTAYPLLFLLFPVGILVAFRGGFVGVIGAVALTAVTAVTATIYGHGPIALAGEDLRHRILLLQVFLAVLVLTVIEVSAVLAHRARLEHDLVAAKDAAEHAERERAESEARYRLITERASDVLVRFKIDGTLTYVSPSAERVTGYRPDELLGTRTTDYTHPEDLERVVGIFRGLAADGPGAESPRVEYRCRHKDGRWMWIELSPTCLFDDNQTPVGFIDIVRDTTVRRQTDDALRLARREAEAASRAKSDFLAAMSHEIRTPLNGIIGYADLLMEDASLHREQRHYVSNIEKCGSALLTIVNDVLDFSRIEAGKFYLELSPFNLPALVDSSISIVRGSASAKGLAIETIVDEAVPAWMIGDGARIRQIILNLLNNAIKFTAQGRIVFKIECGARRLRDTVDLRFSVEDTGIGIASSKLDRLFKQFSQVDESITRRFGGSGLGLAISQSLVLLMDGSIGVTSQEGLGSTFWFQISLPEAKSVAASDPVPSAEHTRARLLLVEDLEINQQLAKAVLQSAGHAVTIASDGTEAVAAVQSETYDVVLMDLQMPVMDGLTATRIIRALAHPCRDVPIVAMTANILPAQIEQMRAAGMDDYIGKPFKRDLLFDAIARALRQKRHGAPGVSSPTDAERMRAALAPRDGGADREAGVASHSATPDEYFAEISQSSHESL